MFVPPANQTILEYAKVVFLFLRIERETTGII